MTSKTSSPSDRTAAVPKPRGIRQTMADLHIWAGLLCGWMLYAMFLTGTVSYFKDEISQWARPELAQQSQQPDPALVARRVADELGTLAAGSTQWGIALPSARNNTADAFWRLPPAQSGQRRFGEGYFDPATGQKVAARGTTGGEFFYRFHFQFHYMPVLWGRWLAGFCAMFMLVAIVSGVITHKKIFKDFFTFRWGKGQRSWLDAHNALSVFGLPFHAMITYTGLVTLMTLYMPWGERLAFTTPQERQQFTRELNAFIQPGKPSGQQMALAPVDDMVRQAQSLWGRDNIARVNITLPGDAASRVAVVRGEAGRTSMSPQYMLFEGSTGKLLERHDHVGAAAETRGVMYALHLGRFGDTVTRWLYFLVSLAGTAMVGTGLVMWTVTRRQRLPDPTRPHFGLRLVERLNIAAIAGLSIAMAAYLWSNRLLPTALEARAEWEIHAFFLAWGLSLLHAGLRQARKAWLEQLWLAVALLALLPLVNVVTTDRPLWHSLASGDWVFAGMDLMLWALAAAHAALAVRIARHRGRAPKAFGASARSVAPRAAAPAAGEA